MFKYKSINAVKENSRIRTFYREWSNGESFAF